MSNMYADVVAPVFTRAMTVAKQFSNLRVEHAHVFAALDALHHDEVAKRFPGLMNLVTAHLERSKGTASFCIGPSDAVDNLLRAVTKFEDLWALAAACASAFQTVAEGPRSALPWSPEHMAVLLDRATAIAGQFGNSSVDEVHVLSAFSELHPSWFEAIFAGQGDPLRQKLVQHAGTALTCRGPAPSVRDALGRVSDVAELIATMTAFATAVGLHVDVERFGALTQLHSLIEQLSRQRANQQRDSTDENFSGDAVVAPSAGLEGHDNPIAKDSDVTAPLVLNIPLQHWEVSLVEKVAHALALPQTTAAQMLANAGSAVAARVVGTEPPEAFQALLKALGSSGRRPERTDPFDLLRELNAGEQPEHREAAVALAVALVGVAHWAAALDGTVTEEEIGTIDELRLELRRIIGNDFVVVTEEIAIFERKFADLVGMDEVKQQLRHRIDYLIMDRTRREAGFETTRHNLNLAFLGNPGTGKTTVARRFSQVLFELGFMKEDRFVEVDRSAIVGTFAGETAKNAMGVIERATGGVLFIDEAYALNDTNAANFQGHEITNILVKQMEDRRERLIVILAGYEKETLEYIATNPGLSSRISQHITFPDYTDAELDEIARTTAAARGLTFGPGALEQLVLQLGNARRIPGFGNARTVLAVIDQAERSMSSRVRALGPLATRAEAMTITTQDLGDDNALMERRGGITPNAIDAIAAASSTPPEVVAVEVLREFAVALRLVLGVADSQVLKRCAQLLGVVAPSGEAMNVSTSLLDDLVGTNDPAKQRAARDLALAVIEELERLPAPMPGELEVRRERLDAVRLDFRSRLGGTVDGTSRAMAYFSETMRQMVGMDAVKAELRAILEGLLLNRRRAQLGEAVEPQRLHLAFVGNPGTGKTTVARLYAEVLATLEILPSARFIEADRSNFVAEYAGQTEAKTMQLIDRATGGVLFIDEAYGLHDNNGPGAHFGQEATNILVKQMEDRRDQLMVIFAGYEQETFAFFDSNPGLRSRIGHVVSFPDYDDAALTAIVAQQCERTHTLLAPGTMDRIAEVLRELRQSDPHGFGNARSVENLLAVARRNLAMRIAALGSFATDDEAHTLVPDDIALPPQPKKRTIGFAPSSSQSSQ